MNLPASFVNTITTTFAAGRQWLARLPEAIGHYERHWYIDILPNYPNLSYNFVAPARLQDGSVAVFKLAVSQDEFAAEVKALQAWNGRGAVKLLNADLQGGAMLLERLEPGTSFWLIKNDVLAASTCAHLLLQLWSNSADLGQFRNIESWSQALVSYAETFTPGSSPIPYHFIDKAMELRKDLLTEKDIVLLHGDLHHDNMLAAKREPFLAIDPKGISGPRGYDVGSFFLNPEDPAITDDWKRLTAQRLEIFSDILGFSKAYLASWAYVHCILSLSWSLEAGHCPQTPFDVASELEPFL